MQTWQSKYQYIKDSSYDKYSSMHVKQIYRSTTVVDQYIGDSLTYVWKISFFTITQLWL